MPGQDNLMNIRIKNTIFHHLINVICVLQLAGIAIYLIVAWGGIPDLVPGHYNAAGEVTRWDGKGILIVMPIISAVLFIGMVIIERFPKTWNTGVKITEQNMARVYTIVKNMLGVIKLVIVTAFVFIAFFMSLSVALPGWFLPAFLAFIFAPVIFYTILLYRAR